MKSSIEIHWLKHFTNSIQGGDYTQSMDVDQWQSCTPWIHSTHQLKWLLSILVVLWCLKFHCWKNNNSRSAYINVYIDVPVIKGCKSFFKLYNLRPFIIRTTIKFSDTEIFHHSFLVSFLFLFIPFVHSIIPFVYLLIPFM